MNKKIPFFIIALGLSFFSATSAFAAPESQSSEQNEYEKSIQAVVRNKEYYKQGKIEFGAHAGLMPYDSLVDHFMVGGRLTWHFADHFGWEIVDFQLPFASTTSYTTDLVSSKTLTNLQVQKIKMMASSNFVLTPLYGKMRFLGSSVLHYDIYLVAGLGFAQGDVVQYAKSGATVGESLVSSSGSPMFDFGLGFKLFLNHAMGLTVDLRDYVTLPTIYGSSNPKSNFSVLFGLTFFLPTFG